MEYTYRENTVTLDDVWEYYKKAIDAGNYAEFTTKQGLLKFIQKILQECPGAYIHFPRIGKLMVKKEWIKKE